MHYFSFHFSHLCGRLTQLYLQSWAHSCILASLLQIRLDLSSWIQPRHLKFNMSLTQKALSFLPSQHLPPQSLKIDCFLVVRTILRASELFSTFICSWIHSLRLLWAPCFARCCPRGVHRPSGKTDGPKELQRPSMRITGGQVQCVVISSLLLYLDPMSQQVL